MADFCKQCSIDLFGEDFGDLANITPLEDREKGVAALVLCEGCGAIQVDEKGQCISENCLESGKPGHGVEYPWSRPRT